MPTVVALDDPVALDAAAAALEEGAVVVIPTDTVYGLAARADAPGAAASLFAVKDRPADVPVAVLVADRAQAAALLDRLPGWADELVDRVWPGPLTVVGRRRAGVTLDLGEPAGTIGVRCPDDAFVQALARRVGPLATTSANRHGAPTPETVGGVVDQLGDRLEPGTVVVDGGPRRGTPSTVVDATGDAPVVLRAGPVAVAAPGRGAPLPPGPAAG